VSSEKPRVRLIALDVLRGFLLLWMTVTHLPTNASIISNQTFGFVSGAEGFIFLAAFMVGQIEHRVEQKRGEFATLLDISKRTTRIYVYHCALLVIAFTVFARVGIFFHSLALQNLLSFYLEHPKQATIAALLLDYRPSLLDILPMYIIFMLLTPLARAIARRWSWDPVIFVSVVVWAAAQFGLRHWLYTRGDLFGLAVPENSTGAFDLFGWQLLWMAGLALGSIYADSIAGSTQTNETETGMGIPRWLLRLSFVVAALFLILRYSPIDRWLDPDVYGWLIDKWHLGAARVINFSAIAIILTRFGARIAALPFIKPLASLGQASIEVFSVHVLFCMAGHALSKDADPQLPWWEQLLLLGTTISALFFTARLTKRWSGKKDSALGLASATR
jgi:hypothetical protein